MALNLTDNWQMAKILTDNWHLYPPIQTLLSNNYYLYRIRWIAIYSVNDAYSVESVIHILNNATSFPGPFPWLEGALKPGKRPWERGCEQRGPVK